MTEHSEPTAAQAVTGGARQLAAETAHQGEALAKDAWGHAQGVVDDVHTQVRTQANEQAQRAAQGLRTYAGELRALGEGRPADAGRVGELVGTAETRLSTWAERLERDGVDGMVDDVSRFARRRPAAFLLLCTGAGLAVGRVTKAARVRHDDGPGRALANSPSDSAYAVASLGYAAIPSHAAPSITGTEISTPGDVPSAPAGVPVGSGTAPGDGWPTDGRPGTR